MTPLEDVSQRILEAASGSDFEVLRTLIRERAALLASGAEVTPHAWELGEQACRALRALKQDLAEQSTRIQQVLQIAQSVPQRISAHREYFG